jgi:tRNA 5-methylaminomethyl-2-thiouridine biosynthesis bifunctional protein
MIQRCFDVLIVGSGLAGASCAFALARRGLSTVICEATREICDKASGNRYALLMPYITTRRSTPHTLYSTGFHFSHDLLRTTLREERLFRSCGGIQLPTTKRLQGALDSNDSILAPTGIMRLTPAEGSERSGISLSTPSFFVPTGGYVSPRQLVDTLVTHSQPRAVINTTSRVRVLRFVDPDWQGELQDGARITARSVVVCSAYEAATLEQTAWLPLEPIRGQTTIVQETAASRALQTLVCFDGYLTPSESKEHLLGAHYRHHDNREEVSLEDTHEILERCRRWLPELSFAPPAPPAARVCFRTSTIDRLPYIGPVPDFAAMRAESAPYQSGTDLRVKVPLLHCPRLFINAGHGSRGLLTCPMGGEIIARQLTGEAIDELSSCAEICAPARTVYRLLAAEADVYTRR